MTSFAMINLRKQIQIYLSSRQKLAYKVEKITEEAGFAFISFPNKRDFNHVFRRK